MVLSGKVKLIIKQNLPLAGARQLLRRRVKKYINGLSFPIDPEKKTILALNHFYDQDLRALYRANRDYNLVVVEAPILVRDAIVFFRPEVVALETAYDSEEETNRLAWRRECHYILDLIERRFGLDLVVTASDIFWWVREIIAAAHERKIPTVVMDKEGIRTPYAFDREAERIRCCAPFMSDRILVWSERQRRFWNSIGVEDQRITVVGQPRSDLFFHERRHQTDTLFGRRQPLVTLFSYHDDAYIPIDLARRQGLSWVEMKRQTHDEFFRLARRHRNYNFVVKTHPQQADLRSLQEQYQCENLAVTGGSAIANELIQRSELIIAFQTTAVIEAMYLGRRVLYTAWDKHYDTLKPHLIPFHEAAGLVIADSFDHFREVCGRFFAGQTGDFDFPPEAEAARDRFVAEYIYRPDGQTGERFFKAITDLIR